MVVRLFLNKLGYFELKKKKKNVKKFLKPKSAAFSNSKYSYLLKNSRTAIKFVDKAL